MQRGTKYNRLGANSSPIAESSVKAVSFKRNKTTINYNLEATYRIAYRTGKYDGRSARHLNFDKCVGCEDDATLVWYYEDDMYLECECCHDGSYCKSCVTVISGKDWNNKCSDSVEYKSGEYSDDDTVTICNSCYHQYVYIKEE